MGGKVAITLGLVAGVVVGGLLVGGAIALAPVPVVTPEPVPASSAAPTTGPTATPAAAPTTAPTQEADTPATAQASSGASPDPTDVPRPEVTPGPASVLATDGPFQLELELPGTTFSASEPVTGQGILSTTDGSDAAVAGSGGGLVHFSYEEIGGTRRMDAAWTDDCMPWTIGADQPIITELRPAGGWSEDDPNADFYKAFASAPDVRLPPGAWRITALADFLGPNCSDPVRELSATTVVLVTP